MKNNQHLKYEINKTIKSSEKCRVTKETEVIMLHFYFKSDLWYNKI